MVKVSPKKTLINIRGRGGSGRSVTSGKIKRSPKKPGATPKYPGREAVPKQKMINPAEAPPIHDEKLTPEAIHDHVVWAPGPNWNPPPASVWEIIPPSEPRDIRPYPSPTPGPSPIHYSPQLAEEQDRLGWANYFRQGQCMGCGHEHKEGRFTYLWCFGCAANTKIVRSGRVVPCDQSYYGCRLNAQLPFFNPSLHFNAQRLLERCARVRLVLACPHCLLSLQTLDVQNKLING